MNSAPRSAGFEVLFVCTANRCRSPLAEHLLRHRVRRDAGPGLDWRVSSAGTAAHRGLLMDPLARAELVRRGVDVAEDWITRPLDAEQVRRADLVLTAETVHRGLVVGVHNAALTRTFTLLQAAQYGAAAPPATDGSALLASLLHGRSAVAVAPTRDLELADPVGGPARAFRRCADVIDDALDRLLAPLRLSGS